MSTVSVDTLKLKLVPKTLEQVLAKLETLPADERAQCSSAWLALLHSAAVDFWTLGFDMVDRSSHVVVGGCGFKGPPADETVEIAYGVGPTHQGKGYATEAAAALVTMAFASGRVRLVCAHTLPVPNASTRVLTKCGFRHVGAVMDPDDGLVWRWEVTPERTTCIFDSRDI